MTRLPRRLPSRLFLGVFSAALLLALAWPTSAAAPASSPLTSTRPLADVSTNSSSRSVLLELNTTTVSAGAPAHFLLYIRPYNCSGAGFGTENPNETVASLTVEYGDGFSYWLAPQVALAFSPNAIQGCGQAPWNASVSLEYSYRNPGTYRVNATATWFNGVPQNSNVVFVTVTAASSGLFGSLQGWLAGVGVSVAGVLVALVVARQRLPSAPSLPPEQT